MAVRILTDSTSYINRDIRNDLEIKIVSSNVVFEDQSFREIDINNKDFYEMMKRKGIPTSAQPSINDFYSEMISAISKGDSLLCIFISSEMSGIYSTAHIARDMVLEEYNNAKIEILDSGVNCMQLGFAAIVAARAAREGKDIDEVKRIAEDNLKRSRFIFIPDNLEYLRKGGRIGGASALIGNLLKIVPILTVEDGKTSIVAKVRTKKKAVTEMIDRMISDVEKYGLGEIVIHHINCYEEAKELKDIITHRTNINIDICDIGPVIGLHVGPGAIGIAYYTEEDMR